MARIVVLTPNPAIDVTYRLHSAEPGLSHRAHNTARRAGGKGVNVCRALATIGHTPLSLSPLGGWSGSWLSDALDAEGIAHRSTPIAGETRFTVALVANDGSHPTVVLEAGPPVTAAEWSAYSETLIAALDGADALVISGSLPPNAPSTLIGDWVAAGRRAGVFTAVDSSDDALRRAAEAGADLLKPNAEEALRATGAATVPSAAATLRASGARRVVISSGEGGIDGYSDDGCVHVEAVPRVRGNPTGAGDAATAGIVSALVEGLPLAQALHRGAALGAAAVLRPVAGDVDLDAYRAFLNDTFPERPSA